MWVGLKEFFNEFVCGWSGVGKWFGECLGGGGSVDEGIVVGLLWWEVFLSCVSLVELGGVWLFIFVFFWICWF